MSGYPTPAQEANRRTILDLSARFDVPIGLSDHTLGTEVAVAAVAVLPPKLLPGVLKSRARRKILRGEPLSLELLDPAEPIRES